MSPRISAISSTLVSEIACYSFILLTESLLNILNLSQCRLFFIFDSLSRGYEYMGKIAQVPLKWMSKLHRESYDRGALFLNCTFLTIAEQPGLTRAYFYLNYSIAAKRSITVSEILSLPFKPDGKQMYLG